MTTDQIIASFHLAGDSLLVRSFPEGGVTVSARGETAMADTFHAALEQLHKHLKLDSQQPVEVMPSMKKWALERGLKLTDKTKRSNQNQ